MTDNPSSNGSLIGVLIGALIVILAGGGILFATGAFDTKPTTVSAQPTATTPAANVKDDNDRRGDRRSDWRDRDRDDRHDRDRDGHDRDRRP
jgi:hypothetical protein